MFLAAQKQIFVLCLTLLMYSTSNAQSDSASTFLSKLYFPFDFGYTISKQKSISNGGLIKTGLEYRINQEKGLFIRFNFNNRNNKFKISKNSSTNVIEAHR